MLYQDMIKKTQSDLGISKRRARAFVKLFSMMYAGEKEAITNTIASYSDDGRVQITYIINGKENVMVLPTGSPYVSIKRSQNGKSKRSKN